MRFPSHARLPAIACAIGLGAAWALSAAWPTRYLATARVMMPVEAVSGGSRIVKLERFADDPKTAASSVSAELRPYIRLKGEILDAPVVRPQRPDLALNLALGGMAGLAFGGALVAARLRRRRPVRNERELADALGAPLLAARPLRRDALPEMCAQLLEHWFSAQQRLLPVVSAGPGQGGSRVCAQLAIAFAELGHKTLLIDGDFRSPTLHCTFNLPNRHGLADFLAEKRVALASAGENLAVIVAGSAAADPLELLSRARLPALLAEASKHFRVVLIDTPAAALGPDFQMFAALAGGALVVTDRENGDAQSLKSLHEALKRCAARLVTTVIHQPDG